MKTLLAAITLAGTWLALPAAAAPAEDLAGILAPVAATPAAATGVAAATDGLSPAAEHPRVLEEKDVLAALQKEIASRLGLEGDLRLAFAQPWGAVRLPELGEWKLTITQLPPAGFASTALVRFRIDLGEKRLGEWQTILRAQVWKPVWIATRRLDRGVTLDSSLCSARQIDVLREKQPMVPIDTDLSLYEMAQTLSQERPLAWRDITLRPLVRKGQTVEVIVNDGALHITMKGLALSSAGHGESVIIRNPDSRSNFTARVVSPNTVQVKF
jgi:flagella basal body P-ring formation protein FlgA